VKTRFAGVPGLLWLALCALPCAVSAQEVAQRANLLPFSRLPLGFPNGWGWAAETVVSGVNYSSRQRQLELPLWVGGIRRVLTCLDVHPIWNPLPLT